MAAVVRIKRRLDEDPLETLVLNCKRRRNDSDSQDREDLSAVLKLAGTSHEEENIDTLLRKHRVAEITELKEQFKKHSVNVTKRLRSDIKESSKNSRYRVVNCFRKTLNNSDDTEDAAEASTSQLTVFDIETDYNKNESNTENKNSVNEDKTKYVYDFYYTSSDDFGDADIQDYVSVFPVHDPLIFGSMKDNGLNEQESDEDSEDSNAENNWKNDYPDEDDLASINEDDMIEAVNNLKIDEDLLSSDSGEEDLVYSREEQEFQDDEAEHDREDELRYGKLYAKFKAKNKSINSSELANDLYYGDIDEQEYCY